MQSETEINLLRWNEEKAARIRDLEAELDRLRWRPITPETVWELHTEIGMWLLDWPPKQAFWHFTEWPEGVPSQRSMQGRYWIEKGYTHYRRENPPRPITHPAKEGM
jgi:hypothetical protein